MKIVVDIKQEPRENDLLIYKKGQFESITIDEILGRADKEIKGIKQDLAKTKQELVELKQALNTKLKEYHDILQIISKGE